MLAIYTALLLLGQTTNFEPCPDQCKVNVRWPSAEREVLVVEGETYVLHLGVKRPGLEKFTVGETEAIAGRMTPVIEGTPIEGPGASTSTTLAPSCTRFMCAV